MILFHGCLLTKLCPMRLVFQGTFLYHSARLADTPTIWLGETPRLLTANTVSCILAWWWHCVFAL
jgi:hypothetical protein